MSIGNAIKVGVATAIGIKLAISSYTFCRDTNRYQKKFNFLLSKGYPIEEILFNTEEQLDILMEQV